MNWTEKYAPKEWKGDTDTKGFILWLAIYGDLDLYHHEKYGEHVCTWNEVM